MMQIEMLFPRRNRVAYSHLVAVSIIMGISSITVVRLKDARSPKRGTISGIAMAIITKISNNTKVGNAKQNTTGNNENFASINNRNKYFKEYFDFLLCPSLRFRRYMCTFGKLLN